MPTKHLQDTGLLAGGKGQEVEGRGRGRCHSQVTQGCKEPTSFFPPKDMLGLSHLLSAAGLVREELGQLGAWGYLLLSINLYKHLL